MNKPSRALRADGEATRKRILEAAGRLFAKEGYAETMNKAIAIKAGVDLASINYYFGSRTGLYQAVLIDACRHIFNRADMQRLVDSSEPPRAKLRKLIEVMVERSEEKAGWHACVFFREVLAPSSHFQILFRQTSMPTLTAFMGVLSEITGIPKGDPALLRCLLSVTAPCMMLLVVRGSTIPSTLQKSLHMSGGGAMVSHLQRFALAGLKEISREHPAATRKNAGGPRQLRRSTAA